MRVVQINLTCGSGSTGKICVEISKLLTERGIDNYILYSMGNSDYSLGIKYTNEKYIKLQALKSRINGKYGFNSNLATDNLLKELKRIKPDIIHLHNLHGHNCNLEKLLIFIRNNGIKLFWTFHDCWAFTGYCPHFTLAKCDKWQIGCGNCVQLKKYSWLFDKSKELYHKKKELLNGIDLTIITPSKWLANIVEKSFLRENDIVVINNGIDLEIFRPKSSDFRKKHGIAENKTILLGVAFGWNYGKGLDVFCALAEKLDADKYQIVLVGTNESSEKHLPQSILAIRRTENQEELSKIYSAADILINPTREDTFPTVNIESLACGTPVITFSTGGSPEILNNSCGRVVNTNDIDALCLEIETLACDDMISRAACVERAGCFDQKSKFNEYVDMYNRLL